MHHHKEAGATWQEGFFDDVTNNGFVLKRHYDTIVDASRLHVYTSISFNPYSLLFQGVS